MKSFSILISFLLLLAEFYGCAMASVAFVHWALEYEGYVSSGQPIWGDDPAPDLREILLLAAYAVGIIVASSVARSWARRKLDTAARNTNATV